MMKGGKCETECVANPQKSTNEYRRMHHATRKQYKKLQK